MSAHKIQTPEKHQKKDYNNSGLNNKQKINSFGRNLAQTKASALVQCVLMTNKIK
jgi:hypothetical protein